MHLKTGAYPYTFIIESINSNEIPEVFYHATTSNVVSSIRKHGLGGKMPKRRWWDYENTKYKDIKQGASICFWIKTFN